MRTVQLKREAHENAAEFIQCQKAETDANASMVIDLGKFN
jgi:hypothetical protein